MDTSTVAKCYMSLAWFLRVSRFLTFFCTVSCSGSRVRAVDTLALTEACARGRVCVH